MKFISNVNVIKKTVLLLSVLTILLLGMQGAFAWDAQNVTVTPNVTCVNGENITITGDVGPGDYVPINTYYSMYVPIINGTYYFDAGMVPIPPGSISATIAAEKVKDMTISTNIVAPLNHTFDAYSDNVASATFPVGRGTYPLVISGNAIGPNAITNVTNGSNAITNCVDMDINNQDKLNQSIVPGYVKLTFISRMEVRADDNGHFEQICCSDRPAGNYTLEIGRNKVTKNVTLIDCSNNTKIVDLNNLGSSVQDSSSTGSATIVDNSQPTVVRAKVNNSSVNVLMAPIVSSEGSAEISFQSVVDAFMNLFYFLLNTVK